MLDVPRHHCDATHRATKCRYDDGLLRELSPGAQGSGRLFDLSLLNAEFRIQNSETVRQEGILLPEQIDVCILHFAF
jgi:hypothetical protein